MRCNAHASICARELQNRIVEHIVDCPLRLVTDTLRVLGLSFNWNREMYVYGGGHLKSWTETKFAKAALGVATFAAVIAICSVSIAEVIPIYSSNGWVGRVRYTTEHDWKACYVFRKHTDNTNLWFVVEDPPTLEIRVENPNWSLSYNDVRHAQLMVDKAPLTTRSEVIEDPSGSVANFIAIAGPTPSLDPYFQLAEGNFLYVNLRGMRHGFPLTGSRDAIHALKECIQNHLPGVSHPEPTDRPVVASHCSRDPTEIFKIARRVVYSIFTSVGTGSAVAITRNKLMTNCHVIEGGEVVIARSSSGTSYKVRLLKSYNAADICIIQSSALLPYKAEIANYDTVREGQQVFSIGTPRGFEATIADGLVSGRRLMDGVRYIQTNAPISDGSSGGGLFDRCGRLIGITKMSRNDAQNINFAVAASDYAGSQARKLSNFTIRRNIDYFGNDISFFRNVSQQRCQKVCSTDSRCNAFSWYEPNRSCWIKSKATKPTFKIDVVSGVRR